MRRVPRPLRSRSPLQEYTQALGDLLLDARADLSRREYSVLLDVAACRIAREIASRIDLEERPK